MNPFTLAVSADRATLSDRERSVRIVEWTLDADAAPRTDRSPLNLAVVIDRSGSMQGEKLHRAKAAACHLLRQLDERDRVALVAFDDEVLLLSPGLRVTPANRAELTALIQSLQTGWSTNLSGGYIKGALEVAEHLHSQGLHRVLLLSDGQANVGITGVEDLAAHAKELYRRGISTSTFGIGLDFNEELLAGMANAGGGRFYYIESPHQMEEAFRQEIGDLLAVMGRDVVFTFDAPEGVRAAFLGDLPVERKGRHFRLDLGSIYAGEQRVWHTELQVEPSADGGEVTIAGRLAARLTDGATASADAAVALRFVPHARAESSPVDEALLSRAARVRLAGVSQHALQMERSGRRAEAAQFLAAAVCAAPDLSVEDREEYEAASRRLQEGLSEADRKARHYRDHARRTSRKSE